MKKSDPASAKIVSENEHLKERLKELEEVLRAIRSGEVDAFVGTPEKGGHIYTLKGAETPYRHFIEAISEGIVTFSPDGTILSANRGFADIIRLPPEKIIGSAFPDLVINSDREVFAAMLNTAINRPVSGELKLKVPSETGIEPVQVQLSLSRLPGDDYETLGGVITDLTFWKQTEDIIRSERLAHSVFEQAGEAIVVINAKGIVIRANDVANRMAGTYPVSQPFTTVFPMVPSGNITAESLIQALLSGSTFQRAEVHLEGRDSAGFELLFSGSPLRNETGEILGSVIILYDITEQKQTETALIESEYKYHEIFDNINEAIFLHEVMPDNSRGHFVEVNNIACRRLGYSREELLKLSVADINTPPVKKDDPDRVLKLKAGKEISFDAEHLRKDGSVFPVHVNARMIELSGHQFILSLVRDMTEEYEARKRETDAIRQIQQNMMQLATINDEIRNPLTVIRMLNELEVTESNHKIIDEQICLIDDLIKKLDIGWVESEKTWNYLMKHHGIKKPGQS